MAKKKAVKKTTKKATTKKTTKKKKKPVRRASSKRDKDLDITEKLNQFLRDSSAKMTRKEARLLVDSYYMMQEKRIALAGQLRSVEQGKDDAPCAVLEWAFNQADLLEKEMAVALECYAEQHRISQWSMSICGIGPVISAGLLAHIDMSIAKTPGHIWSFAGLDPRAEWKKGEKRPWNASLKTLCWKIGESFVKVSGSKNDVYGKLYKQRKEQEIQKNKSGDFAAQAAAKLERCNIRKNTDAYKAYSKGLLPDGHVHARAKRYATKIFLAHWWEVAYEIQYGVKPPFEPYPIAHLGHAHKISPPNWG